MISTRGRQESHTGPREAGGETSADTRSLRFVTVAARVACGAVVVIPAIVLAGWALSSPPLTRIIPVWLAMVPNTAVALVTSGGALWLSLPGRSRGGARLAGVVLAALVTGFGLLILVEYALRWDLGIDRLLFADAVARVGTDFPGRPAPHTAVAFVCGGAAVAVLDVDSRHGYRPARTLTALSAAVTVTALFGHVYRVRSVVATVGVTGMAVPTAVALLLFNAALLLARPDRGLIGRLSVPDASGALVRWLLPVSLIMPVALGIGSEAGRRFGWYDANTQLAAITFATMLTLLIALAMTLRAVDSVEAARQRADAQLRASRRDYQALAQNIPNGYVALFDHDLRYQLAGGALLREPNQSLPAVVGKTARQTLSSDAYAVAEPLYRTALAGQTAQADLNVAGRVLHLFTSPIYDESGQVRAGMAMSQDVTAQREAEALLQRSHDELERRVAVRTADLLASNSELESFSYSVAHDLRAPLRAITGFAGILRDEYGHSLPSDGLRRLDAIERNAHQLGHLIDGLLTFSRLQRRALRVVRVEMGELVRRCWRELVDPAESRATLRVQGDLPEAAADSTLLRQALLSLLGNAVKFSRRRECPLVDVGYQDDNGQVTYFVRDNGVGFDMRYANKLFQVFQRLHDPTQYEGVGMGLALAHRIVARHGGRVWAEAAPDCGATFFFTLGTPVPVSPGGQP